MREVATRFQQIEKDISERRGKFTLFGLFAREDLPDRWDLIVSAPWAKDQKESVQYLVDEIKRKLGSEQLTSLSRIVFVAPESPGVQAMNGAIQIEHGVAEVTDSVFFGLTIKHAYIITSQRLTPETATLRG